METKYNKNDIIEVDLRGAQVADEVRRFKILNVNLENKRYECARLSDSNMETELTEDLHIEIIDTFKGAKKVGEV